MKRNVIYLTLISMLFAFSCNMSAQNKDVKKQLSPEQRIEIKAQRISKNLMLDDATAGKFIPLYKQYFEALAACRCDVQKGTLTDEQVIERLENRFDVQKKVAEVNKKYVSEFAKILTPRQVEKLFSEQHKGKGKNGRKGKNAAICPPVKCATPCNAKAVETRCPLAQ